MKEIKLEAPEFRVVNHDVPRIDLTARLSGRARFGEDVTRPGGVLHGRVLRSPHAHARVVSLDTSAAEALPGVRAVMTAADLPRVRYGRQVSDERFMAGVGDTVLLVGDRVAAVAAEDPDTAEEALHAIRVEYEPLEPVLDVHRALAPDAPLLHPELPGYAVPGVGRPQGGNVASENVLERGDPEGALERAAHVFEQVYTTELVHQAYIEPHACLGEYNPDGTYTVWSSTQATFSLRNTIAEALGVPQNRVRVVPTEVGGGFGGKISMLDEAAAAVLARKAGAPVRMVMTRQEDFHAGEPRSGFHITIRTGVSADGRIEGRTIEVLLDSGAWARGGVLMSNNIPQYAEGPYNIPNLRIRARCLYTNKPGCASMRAPGGPQMCFAVEQETERIAAALGLDSVDFRRRNLMPEGHVSLAGVTLRNVNVVETLDAALEASGYTSGGTGPATPGAATPGPDGLLRARGLALGNWNVGGMPSGAVLKLNDDGSASLLTGVVDLTGVHTALAQIVAEVLDVPVEQVTVQTLDTESAPHSTISAGSQALKSMGGATLQAAEDVRAQLLELAVEALDAAPERLALEGGQVLVSGEPGRSVPVPQLIAKAMGRSGPVVGTGGTGNFARLPSFACHVADVAVDPETGQVFLERYVAAQDCGIAINPVAVDGQVQGGAAQGIGMALSEALRYDAQGRPLSAGFLDYKLPSTLDLPFIETVLVEKPAADGPFGAKGIGEPPVVPPPAAIANAIARATGLRLTALPLTPEQVRVAIRTNRRKADAAD